MDASNFVGPSGAGYDVYVAGKKVGSFANINDAQSAYNTHFYGNNASATAPTANAGSLQNLLDAIASGDTTRFNEAIRQYNMTSAEQGRQFDVNTALRNRQDYTTLASDLLKTASSLRGPQDYFQYQKMLSGGRDLFSQLEGDQPRAQFSNPSSTPGNPSSLQPTSITDIMSQLGFTQVPQIPNYFWDPSQQKWLTQPAPPQAKTTSAGSSSQPMQSTPPAQPSSPIPVYDRGGPVPRNLGDHILAILQAGERVIPANGQRPMSGMPVARRGGLPVFDQGGTVMGGGLGDPNLPAWMGGSGPTQEYRPPAGKSPDYPTGSAGAGDNSSPPPPADAGAARLPANAPDPRYPNVLQPPLPASSGWPTNSQGMPYALGGQDVSTTPTTAKVPLPYQINPAVWDSLGKTGQALALSAASVVGWDPNDYVAQIDASRPRGIAPANTIFSYFTPQSVRASTEGMYGIY